MAAKYIKPKIQEIKLDNKTIEEVINKTFRMEKLSRQ